jgi:hypothetical protein
VKKAEEERLAAAKRAEEQRKAEEERAAQAKRAEEARKTQLAMAEESKRQAGRPAEQAPAAATALQGNVATAALRLVDKGDEYLAQGNILIARQYFLRAAQAGVAAAAFKLAETHDPHELARLNAYGLMPDVAEAKKWYARALGLGDKEAKVRLGRLGE